MKKTLILAASVLALGAWSAVAAPPSHFQMNVDRTASGWSFHCTSGCAWTDLTVGCTGDSRTLVDSTGATTHFTEKTEARGFAFVIRDSVRGWTAASKGGTRWSKVGWGCASLPCRARLNAAGVSGPPFGK